MNTNLKNKNVVIQCRVSSVGQSRDGESNELQEKLNRKFAADNGMNVIRLWQTAISGRKLFRDDFEEILKFIKKSKVQIHYYVFRSIDRATRAGTTEYDRMKTELAKVGVEMLDTYGIIQPSINTLDDLNFKYDWSDYSPSEMSEKIEVTKAKQEVTTILTRMIGQEIRLTQQGYRTRRQSDGYMNKKIYDEYGKKKTIQVEDEKRGKFFIAMFTLRAEGLSDPDIVEKVNAMGYTSPLRNKWNESHTKIIAITGGYPLTVKALQANIMNTIYAGVLCEKWTYYKPVKAQYKGLVDIETFNRANKGKLSIHENKDGMLELVYGIEKPEYRGMTRMRHNPLFPYKIILCPFCGKPFKGSSPSGKSGKGFPTYHCARNHKFYGVKKKVFEGTIEKFVHSLRFKPEIVNSIEMTMLNKYREREKEIVQASSSIHQNIADLQAEQASKLDAIVASKSALVREKLERDVEELEEKIKKARNERLQIEISETDIRFLIRDVKKIVEHPAEILLDTRDLQAHNTFFKLVFEKMPTYQDFVSGTPKMAWIFDISSKNSLADVIVTLPGVAPGFRD